MINRVILLVIDGLGIGALPDAATYGDAEARTLPRLAETAGGLSLPTLESLGLGHVAEIAGLRVMAQPIGCFGRLGFQSNGVDSLIGNWELTGCLIDTDVPDHTAGYQEKLLDELKAVFGRTTIGNVVAAGETVLKSHGAEHLSTKAPLIWTDGRRTCHVAAHETVLAPSELFKRCRDARKRLKHPWGIWRIVAHPVTGESTAWRPDAKRRDFAVEPPGQTMLDVLSRASQILIAVGKSGDLFSGRGLTRTVETGSWVGTFESVNGMFSKVPRGLIYASLDILQQSVTDSAAALQDFDRRLPDLLEQLRPGDLLIITGDHGQDPDKGHRLPTREYVPVILTGPKLAQGVNLGTRPSAADLGQTIVEALRGEALPVGESFLDALQAG